MQGKNTVGGVVKLESTGDLPGRGLAAVTQYTDLKLKFRM